jgi:acyl dehydratase
MTVAVLSSPLDDLEVGARFATRRRTITETDVVAFATLTGDFHPHHVDAKWASESAFGERIAHGMLILSYAVGLVPLDPERVIALRGVRDVVFKRPVRLGDTIHVEGRVESIGLIDAASGLVAWQWSVLNQDERVVMRAKFDVLWSRAPAPA